MSDKKVVDKNRLKKLEETSITIPKFISKYLGIQDTSLVFGNLSHADLAVLFPYLERSNFDYILDNPDDVYNGNIVLVCDCIGNYIPYITKKKMSKDDLNNSAMPISNFIYTYLGVENPSSLIHDLSHVFLEKNFPNLQRESFDYILDNPGELYNGNVVIVSDCKGECIPYVVRDLIDELRRQGLDYVMCDADWGNGKTEEFFSQRNENVCLSNLSIYELEQLMNYYKNNKDFSKYNSVRRILIKHPDSNRQSRLSKQKALRRSANKFKYD